MFYISSSSLLSFISLKLEKCTCLTSLFLGGANVKSDVPLCVYSFMYGRHGFLLVHWPTFAVSSGDSLGGEDSLEEGMATHSSILAWIIPRTEKPGGLQSIGSQRVGHN